MADSIIASTQQQQQHPPSTMTNALETESENVEVAEDVMNQMMDSGYYSNQIIQHVPKQQSGAVSHSNNGATDDDETASFRTANSDLSLNAFASANTTLNTTGASAVTVEGGNESFATGKVNEKHLPIIFFVIFFRDG